MKTLSILRHAKSSWKDLGIPDHERPLNKRGRHDAPLMGKLIRDQNITPDLIISSTAIRAETTAKLVAKACKYKGEIIFDKSVYNTEPIDALNLLSRCSDRYYSILLVGHNPTVEELTELLTGSPEIIMSTCALAHLTIAINKWTDINKQQVAKAKLVRLWNPKELS
jgi:phosphohistidine phosphatase